MLAIELSHIIIVKAWTLISFTAIFCLLFLACRHTDAQIRLPDCDGKKVAILDLSDLSSIGDFPKCELDEIAQVDNSNGVVYSTKHEIHNKVPHMFGTHSAPWYLYQAIKASQYYTRDLDKADIIYVYDYCYYIWWLSDVHSFGRDHADTPGDYLLKAYNIMIDLPSWKKSEGATFALYDPHPGFMAGKAERPILDMLCTTFKSSVHLIVDTPMRMVCQDFSFMKRILVTPYVPNLLDIQDPEAYLRRPYIPASQRPTLAYNRANCYPYDLETGLVGKRMRYWFSYVEWGKNEEMDVRCTDRDLNTEGHLPFAQMFAKMEASKFCIAFPGDSASTRRLSEIFLSGCIPVFLGPPYHSMPFGDMVPYADLGVFFNIRNNSMWLTGDEFKGMNLDPHIRPPSRSEAQWWIPDIDIPQQNLIEVEQPGEVIAHLKAIPTSELERKLKLMHEHGSKFSFMQQLTDPPNAVNCLLSGMCLKLNKYPPLFG